MKKQAGKLQFLLQLALLFSLLGFYSAVQAQAITVQLQVNNGQLDVTTPGSCKTGQNTKGCVGVAARTRTNINFNLPNETCAGNERWQLGEVTLSTSNKGQPGGIGPIASSDFDADEVSGVVTPVSASGNHILIRDNNSEPYDIWYRVSATCGGNTIYTDPRIENGGQQ